MGGRLVNGFPIWQLDRGYRWIYSSLEIRAWMVGGPDEESEGFLCDGGFLTNGNAHNGRMPDEVQLWYMLDDSDSWASDPGIVCIAHNGPNIVGKPSSDKGGVLHLNVPADESCTGIYRRIEGRLVNGNPIWQLDGGHCWIYTSLVVRAWMVGGPEEES